jgi:hypothetical protein
MMFVRAFEPDETYDRTYARTVNPATAPTSPSTRTCSPTAPVHRRRPALRRRRMADHPRPHHDSRLRPHARPSPSRHRELGRRRAARHLCRPGRFLATRGRLPALPLAAMTHDEHGTWTRPPTTTTAMPPPCSGSKCRWPKRPCRTPPTKTTNPTPTPPSRPSGPSAPPSTPPWSTSWHSTPSPGTVLPLVAWRPDSREMIRSWEGRAAPKAEQHHQPGPEHPIPQQQEASSRADAKDAAMGRDRYVDRRAAARDGIVGYAVVRPATTTLATRSPLQRPAAVDPRVGRLSVASA